MSRFEDGCYGSLKGIALIAKVLAGRCKMHYTRVAAGKGTLPEGLTPKTLLEPPEYVMDAIISAVTNPVDGECQVSVQINSAYVKDGFYCTWLVLYAEDPDEGEIPFTALCLETEPEWIRPSSSIVGKLAHFDIIAAVGDVDKVFASIDPKALVTYEEMSQMAEELAIRRMDIVIPAEGWESEASGACRVRLGLPVEGVTDKMIPQVTILPAGESAARSCGLRSSAEAVEEAVRFWAVKPPPAAIHASLTLLRDSSGLVFQSTPELPIATEKEPGAVKPGPGLSISPDGTISVNPVSNDDIRQALEAEDGAGSSIDRQE